MALTGSLYGNSCYATSQAASDAYFSSQSGFSYFDTASGNLVDVTYQFWPSIASWVRNYAYAGPASTNSSFFSVVVHPPAFAACDPLGGWSDGIVFGGLILAAISAAVFMAIISRAA